MNWRERSSGILATQDNDYKSYLAAFRSLHGTGGFAMYAEDIVGFARDVFGLTFWSRQEEVCQLVVENDRIAIRSGHGIGKTLVAAVITAWGVYAREAIVLTTAPTWRQVESILWRELRKLIRSAKKPLPGDLTQVSLKVSESCFALGLSTNEPERFQGYHGKEVIVIKDEAPGVHPSIFEAVEGVLSGGGKEIDIGNPTSPSGPFYERFRLPGWATLGISCWEHPNVVEGRSIIPGAVTREWCERKRREWGEDNPLYQSRVLGDFPTEGVDQVISLTDIEHAFAREVQPDGTPEIWCDVARFGDDQTVIGCRRGNHYKELLAYNGKDTTQTIGHLINFASQYGTNIIGVDDDGVGGGVSDALVDAGYDVRMYRGGERATDDEHFENRRAEAWWGMRETIKQIQIEAPDAEDLKAQLSSTKRKMTRKGRIQMVSKDDMKREGIKSPDRADVIVMAFAPSRLPTIW